ncbi:15254_t:CDS:2, partial [Dentiscutata heterogama]
MEKAFIQKMLETTNTKWSEEMEHVYTKETTSQVTNISENAKEVSSEKTQEISKNVDVNNNRSDENLSGDKISVDEQLLEQQISNETKILKESKTKSKKESPTASANLPDAVKGVSNAPKEIEEGSIIEVRDDKPEDHREPTATQLPVQVETQTEYKSGGSLNNDSTSMSNLPKQVGCQTLTEIIESDAPPDPKGEFIELPTSMHLQISVPNEPRFKVHEHVQ